MRSQRGIVVTLLYAALFPSLGLTQLAPQVDVLVAFDGTAFAASPNPQNDAAQIIFIANEALAQSGLAERYHLTYAHLQPLPFAFGPGAQDTAVLGAMVASVDLSNLRDLHAADLVVLVVEHLHLDQSPHDLHCGFALASTDSVPTESLRNNAFRAVISRSCIFSDSANARISSAHELGHLLYLDHQLGVEPNPDVLPASPVTYNHPDRVDSLATMMVGGDTACAPVTCAVKNLHSDPASTYPGTSIARGHAYDRDDKRMIFQTFPIVARYRNPDPPQIVIATPTCQYEYTGCVGTKKRYLASWYRNGSYPFPRGYAQYSTNNGSTWNDLVNGTQASCSPVVPATNWIIRAFIRTAFGNSAYCYMDILYQPCNNDPPQ